MANSNDKPEQSLSIKDHPTSRKVGELLMKGYDNWNNFILQDYSNYSYLHATHLQNSHTAILMAAEESLRKSPQEKNALVLGAGACLDIPMEGIVDNFDKVSIIEIDAEKTQQALSNMTARQLAKVSLVRADISGISGELFSKLKKTAYSAKNFNQFAQEATKIVKTTRPDLKAPNFGEGYSFICSQLLMTQLGSIPLLHFNQVIERKFGRKMPSGPTGNKAEDELLFTLNGESGLNERTQLAHISQLRRHLGKNSILHFSDTFIKNQKINGMNRQYPMVRYPVMQNIEETFSKKREHFWEWQTHPDRSFDVLAFLFEAK